MTTTLDVLVVGADEIATGEAVVELEDRGHVVHLCHTPGHPGFPCVGVADPSACPLEQGIDVALLIRRGVHPQPLVEEDGARCAIRAGVPLVEEGPDILDPFDPWVTERIGADDDMRVVCERAAERGFTLLRTLIRERIGQLAASAGTSAIDTACLIRARGRDLVIDLHLPVPLDRKQRHALAVRVLDAVGASGRPHGLVDVHVHGHVGEALEPLV